MRSLSDRQLEYVMLQAKALPPSARSDYLELISQQLRITDYAVQDAADRAVGFLLERRDNPNARKPVLHL